MTDPLAELRAIHEPIAVAWWPLGSGWWWSAVMLTLLSLLVWWCRRKRPLLAWLQARRALRELELLHKVYLNSQVTADYLREINAVLRRLALCRYPRAQVAPLSCDQWLSFLDQGSVAGQPFSQGCGAVLGRAPYEATPQIDDAERLHQLVCAWAQQQGNPLSVLKRELPA